MNKKDACKKIICNKLNPNKYLFGLLKKLIYIFTTLIIAIK
jgi:hypothetical protein